MALTKFTCDVYSNLFFDFVSVFFFVFISSVESQNKYLLKQGSIIRHKMHCLFSIELEKIHETTSDSQFLFLFSFYYFPLNAFAILQTHFLSISIRFSLKLSKNYKKDKRNGRKLLKV